MSAVASTRSAPGKVILFGEHSVVYGHPAVATPVERTLTLTATLHDHGPDTRRKDPRLEAAVRTAARFFSFSPRRITTSIASDLPVGCGLGSSAALSVTLLRALADLAYGGPDRAEPLLERATAIEAAFHGTSSGLDVAAVALGGPVWFRRAPQPHATPLPIGRPFALVVATTPRERSTADQVRRMRGQAATRPEALDRHFTRLGALTRAGRDALRTGDLPALGLLLDEAHGVLADLGLSTPALEHAVTTARAAGALGAKLTGAGGGGAVIALAPDNAPAVASALRRTGYGAFTSRVGATARLHPQEM
ncbi:mevalonate kinase [Kitasatospora sp. NPDC097605]|uniref:mevalonate kinase n=1 Tax=Kitasatospora sp. NPDC097605 TaxID=3157226 RepID=UPI003320F740